MVRAQVPASPQDEAARTDGRLADGCVLTRELADFLQSGLSIIVASVARDGAPVAGVALACRVEPSGLTRLILREPANRAVLAALRDGAAFAATFSRPMTHRSIQLKAATARTAPPHAGDEAAVGVQTAVFAAELIAVDHTEDFARLYVSYLPEELLAVEFLPAEAFVQTPGPGAGDCLTEAAG